MSDSSRPGDLAWLDEIDFDASAPWLQMGTRALGEQPWLVVDRHRAGELAEKARLLATRHHDVFAVVDDEKLADPAPGPDAAVAGAELLSLVRAALVEAALVDAALVEAATAAEVDAGLAAGTPPDLHPLDLAGRLVQEDLCLLRRREVEGSSRWCLDAASLCFPSRWRLADKLGLPMGAVHGPVPGYDPVLVDRVDRLLDALADGPPGRVVRRRNWFVHPDGSLFQPERPADEAVVPVERIDDELFVRSERQTLRALDCGWVVFTIRIQQATLGQALTTSDERRRFATSLLGLDAAAVKHRGLTDGQVVALQEWAERQPRGNRRRTNGRTS